MSGHSKWSTIKRKKEKEDSKRAKVFNKVIRELTTAAREGGGDPDANPRLRTALDNAKSANMPQDNIERAIKKGTGELPGASYDSAIYEGYGPGGVAIYVEVLTDNKNRSVAEIRHIFSKNDGHLGENGCVAWMFTQKGQIYIDTNRYEEDTILDVALESGAEDVVSEDELFIIVTSSQDFIMVKDNLEKSGILIGDSEISMIPKSMVKVEGKDAGKVLKLMEALEDHDDVQRVSSNFDIDEEIIRDLESQAG
jgi:YebC/PmpR family DNA-binding regulatory protein